MMHGLEVEKIIDRGNQFDQVVVGHIAAIRPHPNADKLRLADVIVAANGKPQEIVCGAPNIEVGQKVAVALLGAKLPNGLTIEPRNIRGITSQGMICSEDELGLGKSRSGILVLDSKLNVGAPLATAMGLDDIVLDLAIPANRADLMSVRGLAWEIGAMLGKNVKLVAIKRASKTAGKKSVAVTISAPKLCSLYTARVIRGVTNRPTPTWLQSRLPQAGMRSINAVVDATNYVMLEYGQPLHAFDVAKVNEGNITVRAGRVGEKLVTLDGQTRQLDPHMLVIADPAGPLAIAGVMGGKASEVTGATTDIILESAIFDSVSIRQTSRRLNLVSEASKRFERGLWPGLSEQASAAAVAMIVELCGGTIEQGSVHVGTATTKPTVITITPAYVTERLGMNVSAVKTKTILTKLGFKIAGTGKSWKVTVPEWRLDVTIPEDLVDEIGRTVGYEKLPKKLLSSPLVNKDMPPMMRFAEEVKNLLVDMGCTEVISHAFYGADHAKIVPGNHFEVANPLDATQHKLRKSLLPQIDNILKRQADAGRDAAIFEIGNVFNPDKPGSVEQQQSWKLALGSTHKGEAALQKTITMLQQKLATTVEPESFPSSSGLIRGRMIEYCEFDLSTLMSASTIVFGSSDPKRHISHNVHYRERSKYPAIIRDMSFWWSNEEAVIGETIKQLNLPLLKEYSLKDKFVKDGKTSYAFSFVYQLPDRTLTKVEVDKLEQKIKDALMKLGATIR